MSVKRIPGSPFGKGSIGEIACKESTRDLSVLSTPEAHETPRTQLLLQLDMAETSTERTTILVEKTE